jgi:signal transduction histidine kinase
MRLALKLLSSLAVLTVLMLGASAYVEERRQDELLQMDVEAEKRLAVALHAVVLRVCELNGPSTAREVIETLNENTPRNIRWLEPDQVPQVPGKDLPGEVASKMASGEPTWAYWPDPNGESIRYLYIPVAHGGKPLAVIEASQSMAPRRQYVAKEHVRTAAVGFLVLAVSGALAALLGRRLVGKPAAALTHGLRRLGEGDTANIAPPRLVERRDEFGALALELNALGERLAERERMRHDDRLRTVGQLASGVAHELGTPLSVVAVRARLIASGEATGDEAVSNANAILEQSERMTRLVRQLLDYSRRGGNGTATTVDLRQTMLQSIEMLEPLARTHDVSVVAEAEPGDVQVRGDAAQLQQVFTNLVINAIQAMPTGGRVEVRCGREWTGKGVRPAEHCFIRVSDEGPGVRPEDVEHVFEPFFTTKAVGEGTGLGLAVAQAIVEEHGGWIAVQNLPTHGAAFTVYLPPLAAAARLAS